MTHSIQSQLTRIKNSYVIGAISKNRAKELGEEALDTHYVRMISANKEELQRRFRTLRTPTDEQMKPLEKTLREVKRRWRRIINDVK
jgi:hypothetical protein